MDAGRTGTPFPAHRSRTRQGRPGTGRGEAPSRRPHAPRKPPAGAAGAGGEAGESPNASRAAGPPQRPGTPAGGAGRGPGRKPGDEPADGPQAARNGHPRPPPGETCEGNTPRTGRGQPPGRRRRTTEQRPPGGGDRRSTATGGRANARAGGRRTTTRTRPGIQIRSGHKAAATTAGWTRARTKPGAPETAARRSMGGPVRPGGVMLRKGAGRRHRAAAATGGCRTPFPLLDTRTLFRHP